MHTNFTQTALLTDTLLSESLMNTEDGRIVLIFSSFSGGFNQKM
jgi:hypothetical protein